jgi:hypothetical protein
MSRPVIAASTTTSSLAPDQPSLDVILKEYSPFFPASATFIHHKRRIGNIS